MSTSECNGQAHRVTAPRSTALWRRDRAAAANTNCCHRHQLSLTQLVCCRVKNPWASTTLTPPTGRRSDHGKCKYRAIFAGSKGAKNSHTVPGAESRASAPAARPGSARLGPARPGPARLGSARERLLRGGGAKRVRSLAHRARETIAGGTHAWRVPLSAHSFTERSQMVKPRPLNATAKASNSTF